MTNATNYVFYSPWGALDGRIFAPAGESTGVVTVSGSWLTVKEQMPERYAAALVERGFTAVTFDFPGFGGSGGSPRQAEVPSEKAAVIGEVVRQVAALGLGPDDRVLHLAVCASAQYTLRAIAEGAPIAAFASVAGWFHDAATVADLYGGPDGVADRIARGRSAGDRFLSDSTVDTVPAYRKDDQDAAMFIELDYYADPQRGAIPQWRNEMATLSWEPWLRFDGLTAADHVAVPALFVHGDDCVLPDNARTIAAKLGAELVWTEGFQTDFYDLAERVEPAADAAADFFRDVLSGGPGASVASPANLLPRLVHAVDRLDWAAARACFADELRVDYSELTAEPAATTSADALVEQWQSALPGLIATQHLLGPILTTTSADGTTIESHVRAWHHLPDAEPWVVAGHYIAAVDDARISSLTLKVFHATGPHDTLERAAARVKNGKLRR